MRIDLSLNEHKINDFLRTIKFPLLDGRYMHMIFGVMIIRREDQHVEA